MNDRLPRDKRHFQYDEPEDGYLEPGTWTPIMRDGRSTVKIACPDCGKNGTLDRGDHQIDRAGSVTPSVECECGYHEHITLEDFGKR